MPTAVSSARLTGSRRIHQDRYAQCRTRAAWRRSGAAHPGCRSAELRRRAGGGAPVVLLMCSRPSVEKRPGRALEALSRLRWDSVDARLAVAGDGPPRGRLEARARAERLPVALLGHAADQSTLAALQASADVVVAPGPGRGVRARGAGGAGVRRPGRGRRRVRAGRADRPGGGDGAGRGRQHRRGRAARTGPARGGAPCRGPVPRRALRGWHTAVNAFLSARDAAPLTAPGTAAARSVARRRKDAA